MNHTPGPWKLHRGFSDWGLPCQHDIYVGELGGKDEDQIAGVVSITPYCMGAKAKDRELAQRRYTDAVLIAAAPELLAALKSILDRRNDGTPEETWAEWDTVTDAIAKAEGK